MPLKLNAPEPLRAAGRSEWRIYEAIALISFFDFSDQMEVVAGLLMATSRQGCALQKQPQLMSRRRRLAANGLRAVGMRFLF